VGLEDGPDEFVLLGRLTGGDGYIFLLFPQGDGNSRPSSYKLADA